MRARFALLSALVLPWVGGCAGFFDAAPAPLARVHVQDAQSILATMQSRKPRVAAATLAAAPERTAPQPAPLARVQVPLAQAPAAVIEPALPQVAAQARPAADAVVPGEAEIQQFVESWRAAWEHADAPRYVRFYEPTFKGDARTRGEWEKQRAARLANGAIRLSISGLKVVARAQDEAEIRFVQNYSSGRHHDVGEKTLRLKRDGAQWHIVQERWVAASR